MIPALHPVPLSGGTSPSLHRYPRIIVACLTAAFTYVFLANAWLGDDAYITFRAVWNVLHGYGPVFNPGERVQAFTHPLWFLIMIPAHAVTGEFFFTSLAISYGFSLAAVLTVVRSTRHLWSGAIGFLWLLSSKAFVDSAAGTVLRTFLRLDRRTSVRQQPATVRVGGRIRLRQSDRQHPAVRGAARVAGHPGVAWA
ncbi:MAG TPA: hypothetical protein VFO14_23205 [Vicinamibacterales bacterium]|nr:hypothetical protein [Vicinamibacterales bacterium]